MYRQVFLGLAILALNACGRSPGPVDQAVEPERVAGALPELTLAELHRVNSGGGKDCDLQENGNWRCFVRSSYGRTFTRQPAPEYIAPFAAQIYLHPDYTTEAYLLENNVMKRDIWQMRHVCGATLIAPNWAVTAAHCFPKPEADTRYGIRLGIHNISNNAGTLYRVQEVVRHDPPRGPDGEEISTRQNDIALVRFDPDEASTSILSQRALMEEAPLAPSVLTARFQEEERLLSVIDASGRYHALDTGTWKSLGSAQFGRRLDRIPGTNSLLSTAPEKGVSLTPLDGGEARFLEHHGVTDAILMDEGNVIVSWSEEDGLIKASSRRALQPIGEITIGDGLDTVAQIADSPYIFTEDKNNVMRVIDLFAPSGTPSIVYERSGADSFALQTLSEDGRRAILKNDDTNQLQIVDTLSNAVLRQIDIYNYPLLVADDGSKAFITFPEEVVVIDVETGQDLAVLPTYTDLTWLKMDFLENRNHVLLRNPNRLFYNIWDAETGTRLANVTVPSTSERLRDFVLFESEGLAYVITEMADPPTLEDSASQEVNSDANAYRSYVFDLNAGVYVAQLTADVEIGPRIEVFDEGQKLLAWSALGRSQVWDLSGCPPFPDLCAPSISMQHDVNLSSASISTDQSKLFATTASGVVQVWDLNTGDPIQTIFHGGSIEGVQTWKDGTQLMTYGTNGFIRFWDMENGQELRRLSFTPSQPDEAEDSVLDFDDVQPMVVSPESARAGAAQEDENVVTYLRFDETGDGLIEGAPVRAFGWGAHTKYVSGVRSESLREAGLQVISLEDCRSEENHGPTKDLHERVFCARDVVRKTCVGDSGGPVIQGNTLEDAKLVGIISWGTIECDDDGKPGVYTRVASHADWIKSVIGREALED